MFTAILRKICFIALINTVSDIGAHFESIYKYNILMPYEIEKAGYSLN